MKNKVQKKTLSIYHFLIALTVSVFILFVVPAITYKDNNSNNDNPTYTYADCNFEPRIATLPKWDNGISAAEYVRSLNSSVAPSNDGLPKAEKVHSACIATVPLYGGQVVWDVYLGYTFLDYRPVITIKNNNGITFEVFDCKVKHIEVNHYSIIITSNTNKKLEISCAGRFWEEYRVYF